MKYFSYLFFIAVIACAGYYVYTRHWRKAPPERPVIRQSTPGPEKQKPRPKPKVQPLIITALERRIASGRSSDPMRDLLLVEEKAKVKGDTEKVLDVCRKILSEYPDSPESARAALALGDDAFARGDRWSAREYYTFAHDRFPPDARAGVYARVIDINKRLVWSPRVYPGTKDAFLYEVQPGDSLAKIAAKFNSPWRFIQKMNGMNSTRISFGQRIKVMRGADSDKMAMRIVVDKSEFTLTIYLNGYLLKKYPVGLGRDDLTPATTFTVIDRIEKPDWQRTGKPAIPYGDPRNILGEYFIKFRHDQFVGFGIHGSSAPSLDPGRPETIQKAVSAGCIRMFNPDIKELYTIVPRGTKVKIRK